RRRRSHLDRCGARRRRRPLGLALLAPHVAAARLRRLRPLLSCPRRSRERTAGRRAVEHRRLLEQLGAADSGHRHGVISFELTEEQRELKRLAHEFAERELRPIAAECDESEEVPTGLLAKGAAVGLTSYAIPEEHGGGGAGAVTSSLIAEELAWGCAALAGTIQATMFPVRPLERFGTQEQRRRYLPLLARPEGTLGAIAFTEAHAGTDLASIRAEARREGAEYVLSGEKVYVT